MRWTLLALLTSWMATAATVPLSAPTSLELKNVELTNLGGAAFELPTKGTLVFIEAASKCPILRRLLPTIEELAQSFSGKAEFYFVNSAAHDTRNTASIEANLFKTKVLTLMDSSQKFARAAGFTMSTQAVVINAQTKEILYRGPIDDSFSYEGHKDPQHFYLKDAVDAALAGKIPEIRTARAYGCAITFK